MPNENREQAWEAEKQIRQRIFGDAKFILGTQHSVENRQEDCGPNCLWRLKSITCPFFTPTVPCMVGCEVQQRVGVPGEGMSYEELSIRVIAQAGHHLIGEEVVLSLNNPSAVFLRVLSDKFGNPVGTAIGRKDVSLFRDLQPGVFIQQVELPAEVPTETRDDDENNQPESSE